MKIAALTGANTLALASPGCAQCYGTGQRARSLCGCVCRRAFRESLNRYRAIDAGYAAWSPRREGPASWGYPGAEYLADFMLTTRRVLDEGLLRIFRMHFLDGHEWRVCSRRMGIDRGAFFHSVYRIENRLGRAFLELRPYPIYPRLYFAGKSYAAMKFPPLHANNSYPEAGLFPPLAMAA